MWSRSEKAMVVASVLASFQIMASAGSLRANSPFGGVAKSHARAEREMRQAFSRVSLSPQASSPFMARELSHEKTPLALAGPFACCSCVTFRDCPKWRACSRATARFARHNSGARPQTSDHRNLFTPRPPCIYGKIKRNCRSKF